MLKPTNRTATATTTTEAAPKPTAFQVEAEAIRAERNAITPDRNGLPKEVVDAYNAKVCDFLDRTKAAGVLSGFGLTAIDECGFDMSISRLLYLEWSATVTVLEVPFAKKDQAKALGAKWEPDFKTWYVPAGVAVEPFKKWM